MRNSILKIRDNPKSFILMVAILALNAGAITTTITRPIQQVTATTIQTMPTITIGFRPTLILFQIMHFTECIQ